MNWIEEVMKTWKFLDEKYRHAMLTKEDHAEEMDGDGLVSYPKDGDE